MSNINVLAIDRRKIIFLTQFVFLVSIAIIAPLFHQQMITGPIVNATLFAAAVLLGAPAAILVGLIPSVIALSTGLLPPVLAPIVPFIMVSNTILILTFDVLRGRNYWFGVIVSSLLKFIFLYAASSIVINLLLKKEVAHQVAMMMSWPQFLTAVIGGILAYYFLRFHRASV